MNRIYEYTARPGSLGLSLFALAGLILLTAQLWEVMPGYVMVVFFPALLASIAQLIVTPVYGLKISDDAWHIEADGEAKDVAAREIAYLRVNDRGPSAQTAVVLSDGSEIEVPQTALPDLLILIREVTSRGIPVRHA